MRPLERIEKIFTLLKEKPRTLTEIAKLTGMHYRTVKQYVELIWDIQHRPPMKMVDTGKTTVLHLESEDMRKSYPTEPP